MTYREEQKKTGMIRFDVPKHQTSLIKVIGVGGGGCNAVNNMHNLGITGVDFVICNTDAQSLNQSPVNPKIQLGATLTEGRGAGAQPQVGRCAALENLEDIKETLTPDTKMLFLTAGMGGGTGTGAAPVIAATAREMGMLTVGIVTLPFSFEGGRRKNQADEGIKELRDHVDSLLVICNDNLRELYGDLPLSEAFRKADNILTTAVKGIAEIITVPGYINVDFEDVKTVMKNSGVAIMGTGIAEGPDRAMRAVEEALSSPLLNDNNIEGAQNILLNITSGTEEISLDEVTIITDYIRSKSGINAEIIWGNGRDDKLKANVALTIVATGFEINGDPKKPVKLPDKNTILVGTLGETKPAQPPAPAPVPPYVEEPRAEFHRIREVRDEPVPEPQTEPEIAEEISEAAFTDSLFEEEEEREATNPEPTNEIVFEINPQQSDYIPEPEPEPCPEPHPSPEPLPLDIKEPTLFIRNDPPQPVEPPVPTENVLNTISRDFDRPYLERTSNDRISKLKELSLRLKTEEGIAKLEKEPAYVRRQVELVDPKPSSESEVASFTISEDDKGSIEIKTNNTFLHDHID